MNPVCSYKINYPSDLYTVQCTITWISSSVKLNTIHMCVLLCCILHYTYVCSCAGFYTAHLCALLLDFTLHMCVLLCWILHYTCVCSCSELCTSHMSALVLDLTLYMCVLWMFHFTYVCSSTGFYTAHVLICRIVHMCVCICFRKDIDVPLPSLQSFPEFCK